ncbi:MAG: sodium:solute symporter [Armatimonadota bacterium]|nr:sodium:solute symporter [Armatimonadota bacterium]
MEHGGLVAGVAVASLAFALLGLLHARSRRWSVEDYISARYSAGTSATVVTLVASAIGVWVLFSPAEAGTWGGVTALLGYGLGSAAPFLALIPLGRRMRALVPGAHSLTEYLWWRYGPGMYALGLTIVVFYMFIFLTAEVTGIALAVNLVAKAPLPLIAALVGLATVAYTAYGGLPSTVFTDRIQFAVILPLLIVTFAGVVVGLGGADAVVAQVRSGAPALLALDHRPGLEAAATFVVAILAANLFHQGYWQRVYLARDQRVLRRALLIAATLAAPIVILPGLLGIVAKAAGRADVPSVAFFGLLLGLAPDWLVLGVLVLAVALAMSSIDTLLNGLAAVFTADLARLRPAARAGQLLRSSRLITVALAVPAILIASRGYSVLYLFLVADLVCAAAMVPVFLGLYVPRLAGWAAAVSTLAGIAAGAAFFPDPGFMRGRLLTAFVLAAAVPAGLAALLTLASRPTDLGRLAAGIRPLAEPVEGPVSDAR